MLCLWGCQGKTNKDEKDLKDPIQYAAVTVDSSEANKYHDTVESFLNATLLRGGFNGGILIAKSGTVVYEKYVGYKDLRSKDSLTAHTPMQIASTSKTFTAAAILKLAQEGKLSL